MQIRVCFCVLSKINGIRSYGFCHWVSCCTIQLVGCKSYHKWFSYVLILFAWMLLGMFLTSASSQSLFRLPPSLTVLGCNNYICTAPKSWSVLSIKAPVEIQLATLHSSLMHLLTISAFSPLRVSRHCTHCKLEYCVIVCCILCSFMWKMFIVLSPRKTLKKKSTYSVLMTWSGEVVNSLQDLLPTRPNLSLYLSQTRTLLNGSLKWSVSCISCCPTRKEPKNRCLQSVFYTWC